MQLQSVCHATMQWLICFSLDLMSLSNIMACCWQPHVNSIGVFLSAVGAFLVWFFIAQLNFADKAEYLKGRGRMEIPDPSQADIRKLKRRIFLSKIGLMLILIGGLLQIISNYL